MQKEAFRDLITVQRFGTDEEALCLANGLADSVWSKNVGRALGASRRLRVGTVWINEHTNLTSEMSHRGFKQFGYGKDMSVYAVEDYTVVKHVMARLAQDHPGGRQRSEPGPIPKRPPSTRPRRSLGRWYGRSARPRRE